MATMPRTTPMASDADHLAATVFLFCTGADRALLDPGPPGDTDAYRAVKAGIISERCAALGRVMKAAGVSPAAPAWKELEALEARATALAEEFS